MIKKINNSQLKIDNIYRLPASSKSRLDHVRLDKNQVTVGRSGEIRQTYAKSCRNHAKCLQNAICNCDMQHLQLVNGDLEHDTWNLMTCKRGNWYASNFELGVLEPEAFRMRHLD